MHCPCPWTFYNDWRPPPRGGRSQLLIDKITIFDTRGEKSERPILRNVEHGWDWAEMGIPLFFGEKAPKLNPKFEGSLMSLRVAPCVVKKGDYKSLLDAFFPGMLKYDRNKLLSLLSNYLKRLIFTVPFDWAIFQKRLSVVESSISWKVSLIQLARSPCVDHKLSPMTNAPKSPLCMKQRRRMFEPARRLFGLTTFMYFLLSLCAWACMDRAQENWAVLEVTIMRFGFFRWLRETRDPFIQPVWSFQFEYVIIHGVGT